MGRLFQYNRFGSAFNANNNNNSKNQNVTWISSTKGSKKRPSAATTPCPAYSELYTEYNVPAVAAVKASTTTTSKSMELAIKKYQQWSSKFLASTSVTPTSTEPSAKRAPYSCATTSSGSSTYHRHSKRDREVLVGGAAKRPKVYDCMKYFLRRKLFQKHYPDASDNSSEDEDAAEEDATSDYDEVDMLDSSYYGDEEDTSDCASNFSCEDAARSSDAENRTLGIISNTLKAAPVLSCWRSPNGGNLKSSQRVQNNEDDSDLGISDCCQLISSGEKLLRRTSVKTMSKLSSTKKRHNINDDDDDDDDDDELPELLESFWYQPRISSKAALKRLQHALPGSFLVRRKSRSFELWLRAHTKVKHFTVICSAAATDTYKLKGATKQFSSLKALVTHHSVMAEQLPVTLCLPRQQPECGSPYASVRYPDDFDTFESLQFLGILKSLQGKSLEFC